MAVLLRLGIHGLGGQGTGAHEASYMDRSGFVFAAPNGMCHSFLCIVSKVDVKLKNETMRVVGQGCAVSLYIVAYPRKGDYYRGVTYGEACYA